MDEQHERHLRRKAMRLQLQGIPVAHILKVVQRSKAWFSKWAHRFEQLGAAGLKSHSRQPHHQPRTLGPALVRAIVRTRQRLVRQRVGLIGPRAIQREFERWGGPVPSRTTIKRVLRQHSLIPTAPKPSYFPRPLEVLTDSLHALDWTCRYLEDGVKVYAFHTLNLRTRACVQTIAADKRGSTVISHLLQTWQTLGIPAFLQLDNDAAFCGGYKTPRRIGQVVRLCLYVGIELIFLPVAEPERNGEVEEVNGLWGHAFWERRHFASPRRVHQASPAFVRWYMTQYAPPHLNGLTPHQAQRYEPRQRLTATQIAQLPKHLPITAGRIHFIRQVQADGHIWILNEAWKVNRRLAGKYVWATLVTHCRRLDIWYQRSAQQEWRLLKTYRYDMPETVARLHPEFARADTAGNC